MKLVYKGVFKSIEQLPESVLPPNAVKFKEPNSMIVTNMVALLFLIPACAGIWLFERFSYLIYGVSDNKTTLLGITAAFLFIIIHELLHAVCFGKNAKVEMYVSFKHLMAFVTSNQPVTKARFIFLSLFPNLVLGWIPLAIWTVLPYNEVYSNHLYTFAYISIIFGVGDYLNMFNAIRQMPNGSMQQISGMNSYWFMPQSEQSNVNFS